jgi:poly-gamma-glutamate synthase PgsB/CapB
LGLLERFWRDRAWKAVPIRIHVNGTRGKSSVTRLLWAALREAGIPSLAKTTGAAACLLLPDGTERPLRRRGKPNIREQLRTLWRARRTGARAIVLECMALAPELQWTAEQSMTQATIGVITNARTDHTEVMGRTRDEIAACLANTIPRRSLLVVGDPPLAALYQRCAAERGSVIVVAGTSPFPTPAPPQNSEGAGAGTVEHSWHKENQAIALAVTRELGIADSIALAGMRRVPAGAGEAIQGAASWGQRRLPYLDARKANDPESFLQVLDDFLSSLDSGNAPQPPQLFIYNHRSDRPHRLLNFAAKVFPGTHPSEVLVTGERPALTLWLALRRMRDLPPFRFVPVSRLPAVLAERAANCRGFVFCGNIHGLDLAGILPPSIVES